MEMMRANVYDKPGHCEITRVPVPEIGPHQVLIKVMSCGICKGADVALAQGGFLARFPLLNGHEFAGYVCKVGEHVDTFKVGDRVTADNTVLCGDCYYCRKDQPLYCENFYSLGCNGPGGFAEYVAVNADKVFPISDHLSFNEAIFAEPTACAVHSMDRIQVQFGDDVLVYGCGPTGIIMIQLLMHSNANRVVVCGPSQDKLHVNNTAPGTNQFRDCFMSHDAKTIRKCSSTVLRIRELNAQHRAEHRSMHSEMPEPLSWHTLPFELSLRQFLIDHAKPRHSMENKPLNPRADSAIVEHFTLFNLWETFSGNVQ